MSVLPSRKTCCVGSSRGSLAGCDLASGGSNSWFHTSPCRVLDGRSLEHLLQVVPDATLPVWVVTFWGDPPEVFASTPAAIAAVFAECHLFEFFVVPKDLSWLVGENHHDYLIAVGEHVASRLRRIAG